MASSLCLSDLPDEIIRLVLYHLSPQELLSGFQLASRRFHELGREPLLWKHHCQTSFKYWDSQHQFLEKLADAVTNVEWRRLFFYRQRVDAKTTALLDGILNGQFNRIEKFEGIGKFGYDAKDALLRHCHTERNTQDVLARRYYSTAVLDHIHRARALHEWWTLSRQDSVSLERALGAFDMFVLHCEHGDLAEISIMFDELVHQIRMDIPGVDTLPLRQRALAIAGFLRRHNLTGISSSRTYRDLQNSYIGIALQDPDHPSLPLISVAIFCVLSQRLGLDANCCGFPSHVHAVVYIDNEASSNIDGPPARNIQEAMFLDPWQSDCEVPLEHLRNQLHAYGVSFPDFPSYLQRTSTANMVLRTSRNILATVQEFRGVDVNARNLTGRLHANPFVDMDNALYSALWANFLLFNSSVSRNDPVDQSQFTTMILERFERLYPMDASLVERYVCPPAVTMDNIEQWELSETLRTVRASDSTPKEVHRRQPGSRTDRVKYRVGEVFCHRRYGYSAVVIGWDVECSMNSEWMQHNRIDTLADGRHQSFYHALVEDTSIRYVAEENVQIVRPEEPGMLERLAGQYFKRWDPASHTFVSNIEDEYPDN